MTQLMQLERPHTLVIRRTFPARGETPARTLGTVPAAISQVAWNAGTGGTFTVEERWTPPASGGMIAVARTLQDPRPPPNK